jgi:hypothetical protein
MKFPQRRQFLHLAAGAAALPAVSRIAKAQLQLDEYIGGGHIYAGYRFRCHDKPVHRRRRLRYRIQDALFEQFGIREEQRRVPSKQNQARNPAGIRKTRYIMIALDTVSPTQHGRVRAPAIPQESKSQDWRDIAKAIKLPNETAALATITKSVAIAWRASVRPSV